MQQARKRQAFQLHSFNHAVFISISSLPHVLQAHAYIFKTGEHRDPYLANQLLLIYATHQCFTKAIRVLDSITCPDPSSFAALIGTLSKSNFFDTVISIFSRTFTLCHAANRHVLPTVVKACAALSHLKSGRAVHGIASTSGLSSLALVQKSFFHMYLKCNRLRDAHAVFNEIPQPELLFWSALLAGYARNGLKIKTKELFHEMVSSGVKPSSVSWNGIISGFNQSGLHHDAIGFVHKMHLHGAKLDGISISSALSAVAKLGDLLPGTQIHCYALKDGFNSNKRVVSALISMYGGCSNMTDMSCIFHQVDQINLECFRALVSGLSRNGLVHDALLALDRFRDHALAWDVNFWVSVIVCCTQNGEDIYAMDLIREMQSSGVNPDSAAVASLLPACGNSGALMHGKSTHCFSIRRGFSDDVFVGSALIDMYANCGEVGSARACFDASVTKDLFSWNAMMNGYAMQGKANEAIDVFESMVRSGQKPSFISFVSVLSACSRNGLIDQGWYYFNYMVEREGIPARTEHYACLVTLLGRVGKLDDAFSLIGEMTIEPDACVWRAFLSSCRAHKNVALGEVAAGKLFELEPGNPTNYILMSNIYGSRKMWGKEGEMRDRMKWVGLKKDPGCSWIEIRGKRHAILAGNGSMPQVEEKVRELYGEMRKLGPFRVVSDECALRDVEEEEKEEMLCRHCEKTAVVFGLLNLSPRSTIRVVTNLRMCSDCHAMIKFISGFEGREILVRELRRFHCFKHGECSCGDYFL